MRILAGPASQFLFGDLLSFFTRLPDSGIIDSLAQPVSFWRLALSFYLGLLVVPSSEKPSLLNNHVYSGFAKKQTGLSVK